MYIPLWIIIGGIIIWFVYNSKNVKKKPLKDTIDTPYSYKLDISIEPNWFEMYKKACGKSDEEVNKELDKKIKASEKEEDGSSLWGRRYFFTEYYDSASGLTTKFQRVINRDGKQFFYPVSDFTDRGYFFDADSSLGKLSLKESDEERNQRKKLSVEIGENFIRNDIWDKHIGGPKSSFDYTKENYLLHFPLDEIFTFLFTLGKRFHGTEENTVIKWPDNILKIFKEQNIKYETFFDFEPRELSISEYDQELYEKLGKPKITSGSSDRFHSGSLSQDNTYFGIRLKIFRPNENSRIDDQI